MEREKTLNLTISSNLINNYNFNHFSQHNTYQIKTPEMQWVSAGHSVQGEYGHSPWVDTDISSNLTNNITLPTTSVNAPFNLINQ